MSEKEKAIKEVIDEYSVMPLDLEDGAELPNIMGWAGFDFQLGRARHMEEIAQELGSEPPGTYKTMQHEPMGRGFGNSPGGRKRNEWQPGRARRARYESIVIGRGSLPRRKWRKK